MNIEEILEYLKNIKSTGATKARAALSDWAKTTAREISEIRARSDQTYIDLVSARSAYAALQNQIAEMTETHAAHTDRAATEINQLNEALAHVQRQLEAARASNDSEIRTELVAVRDQLAKERDEHNFTRIKANEYHSALVAKANELGSLSTAHDALRNRHNEIDSDLHDCSEEVLELDDRVARLTTERDTLQARCDTYVAVYHLPPEKI